MPIFEKIQKVREESIKMDWSPDKTFPKAGKMIPFVSGEKMKKQFAPLFAKNGIDFNFEIEETTVFDVPGRGYEKTLQVVVNFTFTDTQDGTSSTTKAVGFAPADDLHGPKTAVAYALNMCLSNRFLICDNTEDMEDVSNANVITTLKAKAVEPSEKEVRNTPKTEQKPVEVSAPVKIPVKPLKTDSDGSTLSLAEKRAAEVAYDKATKWYSEGKIVETQYNSIKEIYEQATDSRGVFALMSRVREIEKDIGTKEAGF